MPEAKVAGAEDHLKRQLGMLHQSYLELAKRVVSQLQQFDSMMRNAMSGRPESTPGEEATTSTSKKFDNHGMPLAPQPAAHNGASGHNNGHGLPLEP